MRDQEIKEQANYQKTMSSNYERQLKEFKVQLQLKGKEMLTLREENAFKDAQIMHLHNEINSMRQIS